MTVHKLLGTLEGCHRDPCHLLGQCEEDQWECQFAKELFVQAGYVGYIVREHQHDYYYH